jgi:NDP-sugar pyrophosphorylase family protein
MAIIKHAVILAAGRGHRMMPLTLGIPKPMAPFRDSTLIAHGIAKVRRYIPNIHVTVGYRRAMLAQHLFEIGVSSVINTDGQSNSWWIFNSLLRNLDDPLFVLTCDNVIDIDFALLEKDYFASGSPACMLVGVKPVAGLEGDFIFHEQRRVKELTRSKPAEIYCSGIQVLNPARVRALALDGGDFYDVWKALVAADELVVSSVHPSNWFTVDTVDDLDRAHQATPASFADR